MSRQPCRVLYAKYNSTRSPEYRVTTEICQRAEGRFVRKRAGDRRAGAHLEAILKNRDSLKDYYRDIQVIDVQSVDGALEFPYVKGQTLAEQIDAQHLEREDFIALVNQKLAAVLSIREKYLQPFKVTDGFKALFGDVSLGAVPAACPANIDSLLTNFIESDSGIHCIDYEWVCQFPVPLDFIRYRILLYLYVTQARAQLKDISLEEMLGWFGITGNVLQTYWQMDDHFQQIAHGEGRKYMYPDRYRKQSLSVDQLANQRSLSKALLRRAGLSGRVTLDRVKQYARRHEPLYFSLRAVKDTLYHGPSYAKKRWDTYRSEKKKSSQQALPSDEALKKERRARFPKAVTFSIAVPLYNPSEEHLCSMLDSVLNQTYERWELCLADASDAAHGNVEKLCDTYAAKDGRVKYRRLEGNPGPSGIANACFDMAAGDYIALLDADDALHPSALHACMTAICQQNADFIYTDESAFRNDPFDAFNPLFKPDYAPDSLRGNNYIGRFVAFNRALMERAGGGYRPEYEDSREYDLILRLTEQASHIAHVPRILYYRRARENTAVAPEAADAAKRAIGAHLSRVGLEGEALDSNVPSVYRLKYRLQGEPLVSILIPNMDHVGDLKKCVDSIRNLTSYTNWEIVIIENNSKEEATFAFYDALTQDPRIRVVRWEGPFNFSAINNFGFKAARGEHILLLNNDTEVISPDWLQEMLMYSQRPDVGAVGAKLYYPDHTIQHAGLGIGLLQIAGHYHRYCKGDQPGYMGRLAYAQDLSGVTAACMMLPRRVFESMNGLDEAFEVAFNDVDLCMRIRKAGYLIVFTPFAELVHYESKSRGLDESPEKLKHFEGELRRFQNRWSRELIAGDPYYNPNLSPDREDFTPR